MTGRPSGEGRESGLEGESRIVAQNVAIQGEFQVAQIFFETLVISRLLRVPKFAQSRTVAQARRKFAQKATKRKFILTHPSPTLYNTFRA